MVMQPEYPPCRSVKESEALFPEPRNHRIPQKGAAGEISLCRQSDSLPEPQFPNHRSVWAWPAHL